MIGARSTHSAGMSGNVGSTHDQCGAVSRAPCRSLFISRKMSSNGDNRSSPPSGGRCALLPSGCKNKPASFAAQQLSGSNAAPSPACSTPPTSARVRLLAPPLPALVAELVDGDALEAIGPAAAGGASGGVRAARCFTDRVLPPPGSLRASPPSVCNDAPSTACSATSTSALVGFCVL